MESGHKPKPMWPQHPCSGPKSIWFIALDNSGIADFGIYLSGRVTFSNILPWGYSHCMVWKSSHNNLAALKRLFISLARLNFLASPLFKWEWEGETVKSSLDCHPGTYNASSLSIAFKAFVLEGKVPVPPQTSMQGQLTGKIKATPLGWTSGCPQAPLLASTAFLPSCEFSLLLGACCPSRSACPPLPWPCLPAQGPLGSSPSPPPRHPSPPSLSTLFSHPHFPSPPLCKSEDHLIDWFIFSGPIEGYHSIIPWLSKTSPFFKFLFTF